jgi:hypothetical protein
MAVDTTTADLDIVAIVSVTDLLDRGLIESNGLDPRVFAARRCALWTAPTARAAGTYVAWHNAFYSMSAEERRWLAGMVAGDVRAAVDQGLSATSSSSSFGTREGLGAEPSR